MSFLLHKNNQASRTLIQLKLTINKTNDVHAQEADPMTERVICVPSTESVKPDSGIIGKSLQRKCAHHNFVKNGKFLQ